MKLSITNIALPPYKHSHYFSQLRDMDIEGLEVATSRAWEGSLNKVKYSEVVNYSKEISDAGLTVVGLHSLLYGVDDCDMFSDYDSFKKTVDYFKLLAAVCGDLGGHSLVYGSGRNRGDLNYEAAFNRVEHFIELISPDLERNGVFLCFEPLGIEDSDFINTIAESIQLIEKIQTPNLRLQIDVKAVIENDDFDQSALTKGADYLAHVHVNTLGLGLIGREYMKEHNFISHYLADINYHEFITIEQVMKDENDVIEPISKSCAFVNDTYRGQR